MPVSVPSSSLFLPFLEFIYGSQFYTDFCFSFQFTSRCQFSKVVERVWCFVHRLWLHSDFPFSCLFLSAFYFIPAYFRIKFLYIYFFPVSFSLTLRHSSLSIVFRVWCLVCRWSFPSSFVSYVSVSLSFWFPILVHLFHIFFFFVLHCMLLLLGQF